MSVPQDIQELQQYIAVKGLGEVTTEEQLPTGELLHFDSVEDFKLFAEEINNQELSFTVAESEVPSIIAGPSVRDYKILTADVFGSTLPFTTKYNLAVNYTQPGGKITSVTDVSSWLSGPVIAVTWEQNPRKSWFAYYTDSTNTASEISAYGVMTLGVDISGFPIGYKWNIGIKSVLYAG